MPSGEAVAGALGGGPGSWSTATSRVYLSAGVNNVVVTGTGGAVTLDKLTVTPVSPADPAVRAATATYQAEDGALT